MKFLRLRRGIVRLVGDRWSRDIYGETKAKFGEKGMITFQSGCSEGGCESRFVRFSPSPSLCGTRTSSGMSVSIEEGCVQLVSSNYGIATPSGSGCLG